MKWKILMKILSQEDQDLTLVALSGVFHTTD